MSIHVWGATGFEAAFAVAGRGEDGWRGGGTAGE